MLKIFKDLLSQRPDSVLICIGDGSLHDEIVEEAKNLDIYKFINDNFDFSVDNIIKELNLNRPIYYQIASYGHFGRNDLNLPWERIKEAGD